MGQIGPDGLVAEHEGVEHTDLVARIQQLRYQRGSDVAGTSDYEHPVGFAAVLWALVCQSDA